MFQSRGLFVGLLVIGLLTRYGFAQSVSTTPAVDFTIAPEHDTVFGLDFLGWGFDITTSRDPFYALKPPLFDYSYAQGPTKREQTYRYPTDDTVYSVPDQVFVRTVARTTTDTFIFKSSEEERLKLDITLGLHGETTQLSGTLNFDFHLVQQSDVNQYIIRNEATTQLFQLYLATNRILKTTFTDRLAALKDSYESNKQDWDLLVYDFGSHYVDSVVVGGSVAQKTIVTASSSSQVIQFSIAIEGRYQGKSGTSGSLSLGVDYDQAQSYTEQQTTSEADILGGAPEFTDFILRGGADDSTRELFATWKSTLVGNPVTVRYRLVDIWTLATPQFKRLQLCKAVAKATGLTAQKDVNNYCSSNPKLVSTDPITASLP